MSDITSAIDLRTHLDAFPFCLWKFYVCILLHAFANNKSAYSDEQFMPLEYVRSAVNPFLNKYVAQCFDDTSSVGMLLELAWFSLSISDLKQGIASTFSFFSSKTLCLVNIVNFSIKHGKQKCNLTNNNVLIYLQYLKRLWLQFWSKSLEFLRCTAFINVIFYYERVVLITLEKW